MAKFANILGTVGNTPVVRINKLAPAHVNLFAKIEAFNPLGSVKDRLALVLTKEMPDTKIVVCEPAEAPMLTSGIKQERNEDGSPAKPHPAFKPHPMQGWSPDFIPKITGDAVDMNVVDRILTIPNADAMKWSKKLAQ